MMLAVYGNNDSSEIDVGGVPVTVSHFHPTASKKNTPVSGLITGSPASRPTLNRQLSFMSICC
jgi:hypothetical protein